MIFFDDSITKDRADRCVTHHHACDCREYACRKRIAELEAALSDIAKKGCTFIGADCPDVKNFAKSEWCQPCKARQALLPGRGDEQKK